MRIICNHSKNPNINLELDMGGVGCVGLSGLCGAWQRQEVSGSLSTRLRLIKLHCECHCKVSKMRLAAGAEGITQARARALAAYTQHSFIYILQAVPPARPDCYLEGSTYSLSLSLSLSISLSL